MAFCGPRTAVFDWKAGWNILGKDGRVIERIAGAVRANRAVCRGNTLVVRTGDRAVMIDFNKLRHRGTIQVPGHPAAAMGLTRDGKHLILSGGPTGWQIIPLP